MNKLSNNFTYGVEVEGLFTTAIIDKLARHWDVDCKRDGSVRVSDIEGDIPDDAEYDSETQEINVGIFKTQKQLLDVLELLNSDNHFFDRSCGLHVHIKPKRNREIIRAKVADVKFLKKLQKFAYTELCDHVAERKQNSYARPYTTLFRTKRQWNHEKYCFVRPHPSYDTLEFRFFSPCEHKVKNVKLFLEYFFAELSKQKLSKKTNCNVTGGETLTTIDETYTLNPEAKNVSESFSISKTWRDENELTRRTYSVTVDAIQRATRSLIENNHPSPCHCSIYCAREARSLGCDCRICTSLNQT